MKIGILSGTFDPVHKGHIMLAETALSQLELDEVWFLPERIPRKKKNVTDYAHRYAMLASATEYNPALLVKGTEESTHTPRTLQSLNELSVHEFVILVGADVDIESWEDRDSMLGVAAIKTFARAGERADVELNHSASSKDIREELAAGEEPHNLPAIVLDYIREQQIYQSSTS